MGGRGVVGGGPAQKGAQNGPFYAQIQHNIPCEPTPRDRPGGVARQMIRRALKKPYFNPSEGRSGAQNRSSISFFKKIPVHPVSPCSIPIVGANTPFYTKVEIPYLGVKWPILGPFLGRSSANNTPTPHAACTGGARKNTLFIPYTHTPSIPLGGGQGRLTAMI